MKQRAKPKKWTDKEKITYLLELTVKQEGAIGRLTGRLDAHLEFEHGHKRREL